MNLTPKVARPSLFFWVLILFFGSGFTSLVYQVIWIRQLSLAVGSTSASMSLVLSIFFLGLAGGSALSARFHKALKKPLLSYGLLEGFIGLYSALLVYWLFDFQSFLVWIYPQGNIGLLSQILKFILVFILLLGPTLAMGATLPLLVKALEHHAHSKQSVVSIMYGINTLGAVAGSFFSGFVLIPALGIERTNHFSVAINLLLLLGAWLLNRHPEFSTAESNSPPKNPLRTKLLNKNTLAHSSQSTPKSQTSHKFFYLTLAATCGFATISAEVVWGKYLGIFMGTNIYGLSLVLSLFLLGIALGSLALPKISKIARHLKVDSLLLGLVFLLAISLWLSTLFLGKLPLLSTLLAHYLSAQFSLLSIKFVLAAGALLVPTFISGLLLPLLIDLLSRETLDLPQSTGSIYSINTVGSIAGSYLSGIILIPLIGSSGTLKLAILSLASALFMGLWVFQKSRRLCALGLLFLLGMVATLFTKNTLQFKDIIRSAYHQSYSTANSFSEILKLFSDTQEEFIKIIEGESAIISLSHDQADGPEYKRYVRLKTNGLNESIYDSQNKDSLPKYEALLGLLPYVLAEQPKNAFLVGYGGGFSTHFFGSTDLEQVTVAELEAGIIDAANFVWKGKNPILAHENIHLKIEDARFLLAVGNGAPYDMIASQPSHSWLSGVANLFTLEFFTLVKSRLKPKGIFSQWLNLYNINEDVLKSILKTFFTVFPHGAVFTDLQDDEVILIGSLEPLNMNIEKATHLMNQQKLQPLLKNLAFHDGYDLLTHLTVSRKDVLKFTEDSPLNTDVNAYAETRQSKLFYNPQAKTVQDFLDRHFDVSYEDILVQAPDEVSHWERILNSLKRSQNYTKYNKVLNARVASLPSLKSKALAYYEMERYASAKQILFSNAFKPKTREELNLALQILTALGEWNSAIRLYENSRALGNAFAMAMTLESHLMVNHWKEAKLLADRLEKNWKISFEECGDSLEYYLGHYYFKVGQPAKAVPYLNAFYQKYPQNLGGIKYLIGALIAAEANDSAYAFITALQEVKQTEFDRLKNLRDYYVQTKAPADAQALDAKLHR